MLLYTGDEYSKAEKVMFTLFQVGAMSQSNLASVLGWNNYSLSKVITSINKTATRKTDIKIGEIPERIGVKNTGKIRFLTMDGLQAVSVMIGNEVLTKKEMLNEAELRIAAQLARIATTPDKIYYGHYAALSYVQTAYTHAEKGTQKKYEFGWPITLFTNDSEDHIEFVMWVPESFQEAAFRQRVEFFREITEPRIKRELGKDRKLPKLANYFLKSKVSTVEFNVIFVCQTAAWEEAIETIFEYVNPPVRYKILVLDTLKQTKQLDTASDTETNEITTEQTDVDTDIPAETEPAELSIDMTTAEPKSIWDSWGE